MLAALTVVLVVCACACAAAAVYLASLESSIALDGEQKESLEAALVQTDAHEPYYVLLLGSDAREADVSSRSDTIILARIDEDNACVTLVSIPRDTKVEIPGHGTQKINAAYAFGGAAGAVDVVSAFAGVDVSHYVEIHFDELVKIVDDLGGIWVDVPVANDQTGDSSTGKAIEAGELLMDGETALAFSRERFGYQQGDFQRVENQRLVVQAIASKILSLSPVDLPATVQALGKSISTDYKLSDILFLARGFQEAYPDVTFYSCMTPSTTQSEGGVSYAVTLDDEWKQMMAEVDAGEDPTPDASAALSASGEAGA